MEGKALVIFSSLERPWPSQFLSTLLENVMIPRKRTKDIVPGHSFHIRLLPLAYCSVRDGNGPEIHERE